MTRPILPLAVAAATVAAVALAQSAKPLSNLTVSLTPDAGVVATIPEAVRVVGPTNGNVFISGTVDLSSASLSSLGVVNCTQGEQRRISVTATPSLMPPSLADGGAGYLSRRTGITLVNVSGQHNISCRVDPGDGGLPDCVTPGYGATVFTNGGSVSFSLADDATSVRCVACTGTAPVEILESACTAP